MQIGSHKSWSALLLACLVMGSTYAAADAATNFTLADMSGERVSLSDYAGKPVILHFWASWCPYCKRVQPGLDALASEYATQDLVLLGINFREDKGVNPQEVLASRGLNFLTLVQGEEVARIYRVKGTPHTVFINAGGEVVGVTNTADPDDPKLRELALTALQAND